MSVIVMWNWQEGGNGFANCGNHMAVESAVLKALNDPCVHGPSVTVRHLGEEKIGYKITQTVVTHAKVDFNTVKGMF